MSHPKWPMVPLCEVVRAVQRPIVVEPGTMYRTLGVKWWGEGAYERQTIDGATTSAKTLNLVKSNDLIINKIWVRNGSVAVVSPEVEGCLGSGEFPTFEFDRMRMLPQWMHWYSKTNELWQKCDSLSQGTSGKNRIRPEAFLTIEIPYPPMEEQLRLASKIQRIVEKIAIATRLSQDRRASVRAMRIASRCRIFGCKPEATWRHLGDLIDDIENGWSPQCLPTAAIETEWGVLKVGAVSFGTFDDTKNKQLPNSLEPRPQYEIKDGDFLMSRANTTSLVGACALVGHTRSKLLLCDKIFRFRFAKNGAILPAFLNHVLKSPALRTQIEQAATGTSSTMKNISKAKILSLKVPAPSLTEQVAISRSLDAIDHQILEVEQVCEGQGSRFKAMMPSILDRAFKGEL